LTQTLNRAYDWQLYGLQNESVNNLNKSIADYLTTNGWVASTGPLGNYAQAEWAISFDLLGITNVSKRFVETPGLFIFAARMRLSPEEKEAIMALTQEERKDRYPPLIWPEPPLPNDSLNNGYCPESIVIDPQAWSTIWIDLEDRARGRQ